LYSFYVLVQGTTAPANVQDDRIQAFVAETLPGVIESISQEEVSAVARSLALDLQSVPKSLQEALAIFQSEIDGRTYSFQRRFQEADALSNKDNWHSSLGDILTTFQGQGQRRFAVEVFGGGDVKIAPPENVEAILVSADGLK
jgi:hypothetical protein